MKSLPYDNIYSKNYQQTKNPAFQTYTSVQLRDV